MFAAAVSVGLSISAHPCMNISPPLTKQTNDNNNNNNETTLSLSLL